jgi:hypothetical protein
MRADADEAGAIAMRDAGPGTAMLRAFMMGQSIGTFIAGINAVERESLLLIMQ